MTRVRPYTNWDDVPVIIDLAMLCRLLGISMPTAQKLVNAGDIPAKKVGNAWRVTKDAVKRYVEAERI